MGFKQSSAHLMHAKQCLSRGSPLFVYVTSKKSFPVVSKVDVMACTNVCEANMDLAGVVMNM